MENMNHKKSAFPVLDATRVNSDGGYCTDYACSDSGMTLKEYAAILLKVPRSGNPELNDMIRESVRRDFAAKELAGNVFGENVHNQAALAASCYKVADAMLAEWEKEAWK
jgi:hypothetical protein